VYPPTLATQTVPVADESIDSVLLLGPLYHLPIRMIARRRSRRHHGRYDQEA